MVTCSVFLFFFLLKGLVDGVIITFSQLELFYWKCIYRRVEFYLELRLTI